MSSPFDEPNPFKNPFAEVQTPSAWEAIKERNKQERQRREQALMAVFLEVAGVALAASIAASIGMEDGTFFAALNYAVFGGMCGGGFCVLVAALGVTGAHRGLLPPYFASSGVIQQMTASRGVPAIFPIAVVGALAGIFMFTALGAAMGAGGGPTLLRALLGGAVGMFPVGLWWAYVRHRAGKSMRAVIVLLVSLLFVICSAGVVGIATGALQPGPGYSSLIIRGRDRHHRGDLAGAIAHFNKAIQLDPRNYDAYLERGKVLLEQGKDAEAEKDFERSLRLAPDEFWKNDIERWIGEAKEQRQQKR